MYGFQLCGKGDSNPERHSLIIGSCGPRTCGVRDAHGKLPKVDRRPSSRFDRAMRGAALDASCSFELDRSADKSAVSPSTPAIASASQCGGFGSHLLPAYSSSATLLRSQSLGRRLNSTLIDVAHSTDANTRRRFGTNRRNCYPVEAQFQGTSGYAKMQLGCSKVADLNRCMAEQSIRS
jgi:hypothetical protein